MVGVSYYCPRCGAVVELDRDPYLADKSVTPFPLEGWRYVSPSDDIEADDVDGVKLVCGRDDASWSHPPSEADRTEASTGNGATRDADTDDEPGCGEPFSLNFVKYEDGDPVSGQPESEYAHLAERTGQESPRGPNGPGFSR